MYCSQKYLGINADFKCRRFRLFKVGANICWNWRSNIHEFHYYFNKMMLFPMSWDFITGYSVEICSCLVMAYTQILLNSSQADNYLNVTTLGQFWPWLLPGGIESLLAANYPGELKFYSWMLLSSNAAPKTGHLWTEQRRPRAIVVNTSSIIFFLLELNTVLSAVSLPK